MDGRDKQVVTPKVSMHFNAAVHAQRSLDAAGNCFYRRGGNAVLSGLHSNAGVHAWTKAV
jgi:hypothetical protein